MKIINWIINSINKYGKKRELKKENDFVKRIKANHKVWIKR